MEQIDLTSNEDITEFTDEEHVAVKKVNHQFQQVSKLKGIVRDFSIFNDIQCYQMVTKKHGGKHKFRINLTYLDPQPERNFILADSWLITAAISAIFSFLLVYAGWFSTMQLNQTIVFIMTSVSISFSLIAFLITLLRTHDRVVLFSRYGHVPILEFINKNPDSKAFLKFMDTLGEHILKAQKNSQLSVTGQLKFELKELRRLHEESAIPEEYYEKAKKRIFSNQAFK